MKNEKKKYDSESIVHHLHHREESDEYKREITISGVNRTVTLSTNFPDENMDYLIEKSIKILKDIKEVKNYD